MSERAVAASSSSRRARASRRSGGTRMPRARMVVSWLLPCRYPARAAKVPGVSGRRALRW